MEGRRPAPLVGYLYGEICIRDRHLYEDRQLCLVVVAVFHGVQCRLGYGSFELLQSFLRQTQPAHDGGHLLHGQAFVARLAGKAEVSQGPSGTAPWSSHRSSNLLRVTRVMSSSCSHPSSTKE